MRETSKIWTFFQCQDQGEKRPHGPEEKEERLHPDIVTSSGKHQRTKSDVTLSQRPSNSSFSFHKWRGKLGGVVAGAAVSSDFVEESGKTIGKKRFYKFFEFNDTPSQLCFVIWTGVQTPNVKLMTIFWRWPYGSTRQESSMIPSASPLTGQQWRFVLIRKILKRWASVKIAINTGCDWGRPCGSTKPVTMSRLGQQKWSLTFCNFSLLTDIGTYAYIRTTLAKQKMW